MEGGALAAGVGYCGLVGLYSLKAGWPDTTLVIPPQTLKLKTGYPHRWVVIRPKMNVINLQHKTAKSIRVGTACGCCAPPTPPLRPQLQVGVACKARFNPLGSVVLEVAELPQPLRLPCAPRVLKKVPSWHWSKRSAKCKLYGCQVWLFIF